MHRPENHENSPENRYIPRVIDAQISSALSISGAIIIEGARACGKTMSALHAAQSSMTLATPEPDDFSGSMKEP